MAQHPAALPVYRTGQIPDGLATKTMLTESRRRPAPGQAPAATLFYHGNQHAPLYRIDATVEMPPPSARYVAARTCARCRATRATPWPVAPAPATSGRRLCVDCAEAEAEASWWRMRHRARAAAVAWAQSVIADPMAVLVHSISVGQLVLGLYAVELATGELLLHERIRHNERDYPPGSGYRPPSWSDPGVVGIRDVAEQVQALTRRRLVTWSASRTGLSLITWNMWTGLGEDLGQGLAVQPCLSTWSPGAPAGDEIGTWYADWHGTRDRDGSWRYDRSVRWHDLPWASGADQSPDMTAQVTEVRRRLQLIATDDHPTGEPDCPALLPRSRRVCARLVPLTSTGVCPDCATTEEANR